MKPRKPVNCEKMNPFTLQSIQAFGVLVVVNIKTLKIVAVSHNSKQLFHINPKDMLAKNMTVFFNKACVALIHATINNRVHLVKNKLFIKDLHSHNHPINLSCYIKEHYIYLELEEKPVLKGLNTVYSLKNITDQLNSQTHNKDLFKTLTTILYSITKYDLIMVYQYEEDGSGTVIAQKRKAYMSNFLNHHFLSTDTSDEIKQYFLQKKMCYIPDTNYKKINLLKQNKSIQLDLSRSELRAIPQAHREFLHNMKAEATLTIPIITSDTLWGLVIFHHKHVKFITKQLRYFIEIVTNIFARQLQQNAIKEKNNQKERVLKKLNVLSDEIKDQTSLASVLARWSQELKQIIPYDGLLYRIKDQYHHKGIAHINQIADVLYQDTITNSPSPLEIYNAEELNDLIGHNLPFSSAMVIAIDFEENMYLLITRKPKATTVKWAGNPHKYITHKKKEHGPKRSFNTWLETESNNTNSWTSTEILAAKQIQRMISELVLKEKLSEKAFKDALTGLYNRHYLDDYYQRILAHSIRHKQSLSLCIIDIDFFKKINDQNGHSVGDAVLIEMANLIQQAYRLEDPAFSLGGEEFVVLLGQTKSHEALKRSEMLRKTVEEHTFKVKSGKTIKLTISIGVVTIRAKNMQLKLDTVINKADQQLYSAKQNGRNQVRVTE